MPERVRVGAEKRTRAGPAPPLQITVLGPPVFFSGGARLIVSDQKAHALLLYLAVTGQTQPRDHLATLFWSELPEANARHSLRSSLYHLRYVLGASAEDALIVTRNTISFQFSEDACDLSRFRRMLATNNETEIEEAIELYRGTLLMGVALADAPIFDAWLRAEQAHVDQLFLNALDQLATWAEAREDWERAIGYVQRIVQMDPLNEDAQQRLMRLYLTCGAVVQALRQYQRFEAELNRELELAPAPQTQALFQRALRARRPTEPTPRAAGSQARQPQPLASRTGRDKDSWTAPFVGRDETLAQLLTICQETRAGRGTAILLHGERGMGKTRLLSELVANLTEQAPSAWTVLIGACSPFDDLLAYGPFYDAFQNAPHGDLSELLSTDEMTLQVEPGAVAWRVLRALRLLTQGGPVLIAIDDVHWANSSTLQLFGFLAIHLRNLPVLLVGTIERMDAIPAVQRLLSVARPRGDVRVIPVMPLAPDAVKSLVGALDVSPDVTDALAEWVMARSGGSPYMLSELLAQLRADAILTPSDSGWRFDEGRWLRRRASFTLPDTVYDLIAWRIAPLAPEARHVLDALAVAGQSLPFAVAQEVSGVHRDRALELVDDLLARGLLVENDDDTLALSHHMLAGALLARMSHLRRRALHRQLLAAIERFPTLQARSPLRQLALHAVAAEDAARARRYGLPALEELALSASGAETLSFAEQLLDLLAPTATPEEQARLARTVGQLHESLGQLDAAKRYRQRQLAIAGAAGDRVAQVTAQFDLSELALVSSDYQAAVAAANVGLSLIALAGEPPPVELSSRGYRLLGASLAMEGSDLSAAEDCLQRAADSRQFATEFGDRCAVLFELGNVAAQRGALDRALTWYEAAGRAAEAARIYYYQALAANNFAYHSLLLGQVEAADSAALRGLRLAETHELVGALVHLYSTLGEIRLYQAEWARAEDFFIRGLSLATDLENVERHAGHLAGLALVARGEGHIEHAIDLLNEAHALIPRPGHWHLRTRIHLWLGDCRLRHSELSLAKHDIEHAHATALAQERSLLIIHSERLSAQLLAAEGKWREANERFARSIQRARDLALALEVARSQAAWGQALLRTADSPYDSPHASRPRGLELLATARQVFSARGARADLLALEET